jgi:Undecaprenyl-phosphate glucose phosphotransferase
MTLRFNSYRFYYRLWCYLLPLVSFALAGYARFYDLSFQSRNVGHDRRFYVVVCLLTTLVWSIAAEHYRLLHLDELLQENTGVKKAFFAVAATYLTILCVLFFYRQQNISRIFFAISASLLFLLTVASRLMFRARLRGHYSRRPVRLLMIGADGFAARVARRLESIPISPTEVVAHVRLADQDVEVRDKPVLDFHRDPKWHCVGFDEIVIALPPSRLDSLSALAKQLEPLHVPIRTVLDLGDTPVLRDRLFQLGDLQFLDLSTTPLELPAYFVMKRVFDVWFSLVVLLFGAPLFATIALAVKASSAGPVLFRQERVGLNGRTFVMYKFRTMRMVSKAVSDTSHTQVDDPRRTGVGAWLRKTSLDEIPQFINVLKGDMSVVGPRPELTFFAQKYAQEVSDYDKRHRLKVGITGWAQVNGWRGNTSIQRRIDADLYYLQNWTFWLDLRIVLMTIFKGMVADHAY